MEKKKRSLQVTNVYSAEIGVESRSHVVAVDQNKENVYSCGVYTKDHEQYSVPHIFSKKSNQFKLKRTPNFANCI